MVSLSPNMNALTPTCSGIPRVSHMGWIMGQRIATLAEADGITMLIRVMTKDIPIAAAPTLSP